MGKYIIRELFRLVGFQRVGRTSWNDFIGVMSYTQYVITHGINSNSLTIPLTRIPSTTKNPHRPPAASWVTIATKMQTYWFSVWEQ